MASGHLSVVPPYVEPRRRSLPADVTTVIRWICFLIFLVSFVLAIPVQRPHQDSLDKLLGDIQSGRASSISVQSGTTGPDTTIRWKTGQFSWWQYSGMFGGNGNGNGNGSGPRFTSPYTTVPHDGARAVTATSPNGWPTSDALTRSLVTQAGIQSGHPVTIGSFSSHHILFFNLADAGVWGPLSLVAVFLWLVTFLAMLFTRDHPYATRWAWFWLFVIGGVGPLLILWKEPVPLRLRFWQRNADYRWTQAPISGGTGFIFAIGWAILIVIAGSAFGWLGGR